MLLQQAQAWFMFIELVQISLKLYAYANRVQTHVMVQNL